MECIVRNATRGTVLANRVVVAASLARRLRGLIGTDMLRPEQGMLLTPCRRVHSFFMRYPLDLVFLNEQGRVVRTVRDFAPRRISPFVADASAVLELRAGALADTPVAPGDLLHVERRGSASEER